MPNQLKYGIETNVLVLKCNTDPLREKKSMYFQQKGNMQKKVKNSYITISKVSHSTRHMNGLSGNGRQISTLMLKERMVLFEDGLSVAEMLELACKTKRCL